MPRLLAALVFVVLVSLGAWWFGREAPRPAALAPEAPIAAQPAERVTRGGPGLDGDERPERARKLRDGAARREAMRRQIETSLAARDIAAARPDAPPAEAPDPTRSRSRPAAPADDDAPGALVDRTGNHGYLSRVLNQDLMPLVDECIELAREGHPELAGMLVLDLEILGDEDIGGVIDTLTPDQGNELTEPALLECVRESLLATTLPPPPQGGRDAISLSLRFDPPAAE